MLIIWAVMLCLCNFMKKVHCVFYRRMFHQSSNNQTNNKSQHSSRVVTQTLLNQATMVALHLPNLRPMVGPLHLNQTTVHLPMQLHRLVQVLCLVVQVPLNSQVVMVLGLQVQLNNLAMGHHLPHSNQGTLHLPQDHSKVPMVQGLYSLAMAPLDHRQIMEQWLSHLHRLDKVWVTLLMPAVDLEVIVTHPHSSSNQDMEVQMQ